MSLYVSRMRGCAVVICSVFTLLPWAHAATDSPSGAEGQWRVGLGVASFVGPQYPGSSSDRIYFYPLPYVSYHGRHWTLDRNRASVRLGPHWRLGLSVDGTPPVTSTQVAARTGMPNVDATVELGPDLAYTWRGLDPRLRLSAGLAYRAREALGGGLATQQAGFIALPYFAAAWKPGLWKFGTSVAALVGDARSNGYFFNVAAPYATADRPAYTAGAGYAGSQLTLSASRRYRRAWAGTFVRVIDYHGTAFAGSPLLKAPWTVMVGFAVYGYRVLTGG